MVLGSSTDITLRKTDPSNDKSCGGEDANAKLKSKVTKAWMVMP